MKEKSISNNFDIVWGRISRETGIKSLRQLAVIIGKKQPTISAAKAKGEFPPGWAYLVGTNYDLLTEWIMTGEGPKRLKEGAEINPLLVDVNEWLNEEEKHKSADFRILFQQQMIRAFFDFEEWKIRKETGLDSGEHFPSSKVA